MNEDCVYCGLYPESDYHTRKDGTLNGAHEYAPPTSANRLRAWARSFERETKELLVEASTKVEHWDALKDWLRTVKTHGSIADDHVSALRDLVYLIEKQGTVEPEEELHGRALLDRAREKRRAALAEERYTVRQAVIHPSGTTQKLVRAGIEVEGEIIGGRVTILSGPAADVDEWLDGRVTLEELGERWRRQGSNEE